MYNYSPETCLIQDTDGKIYNIIDLWNGIKTPVDLNTLQYNYSPRSCLVRNVDGADVNVIDTILAVANGSGSGSSSLEEVIQARGKYSTLGERLDKENEKVYETINSKDFIPFEGQNVKVEHSKIGYTKDMKLYGRTLQNLCPAFNDGWQLTGSSGITLLSKYKIKLKSSLKDGVYIALTKSNISLKANTIYTVIANIENNTLTNGFNLIHCYRDVMLTKNPVTVTKGYTGIKVGTFTTIDNLNTEEASRIEINVSVGATGEVIISNMMILEGDWTNKDIPEYFEGIKSVGEAEGNKISILSKNKNLFFGSTINKTTDPSDGIIKGVENLQWSSSENLIYVKKGDYTFSKGESEGDGYTYVYLFDLKGNYLGRESRLSFSDNKINIPFDCKIRICCRKRNSNGWQLEEGIQATPYEPYKEYKKEIQLQQPFAGLEDIQDTIEETSKGVEYTQNIGKIVLNGTENWIRRNMALENETIGFGILNTEINNYKIDGEGKCDKFIFVKNSHVLWNIDKEGFCCTDFLQLRIKKSKLETQDIAGLKKYLQANPVTVYYQLAEPIEHKIVDLNTTNLETFKDITHVSSENGIQPNLSFKAPVNVQATISMLRENNARLSGEVDNKTKELQAKDEYLMNENDLLTAKDLDMDFRIFELEEQLMPEVAKLSSNYNSPYSMIERCIERGLYEKEDMLYKMGRYFHGNRLTQEEYDKLKLMMG